MPQPNTRKQPRRRGRIVEYSPEKWQVRVCLGRDSNGKQLYVHEHISGKRRDAERALTALLQRKDEGTLAGRSRETLDQWIATWLEVHCQGVTSRTRNGYRASLDRYLPAFLKARRLSALTATDIQGWLNKLADNGSGKPGARTTHLSPLVIRNAHAALRACLSKAVVLGKISQNAAKLAHPPTRAHREMRCFTAEEAQQFLNVAQVARSPHYAYFILALHTGLRPGEMTALKWEDLEGNLLRVRRAHTRPGPGQPRVEAPTKTRRPRVIPLGRQAQQALAQHRREQIERRLLLGDRYVDRGYIFTTTCGAPVDDQNILKRHFKPLLKTAGLPALRLYDLRHTHATLLLAAGEHVKVVSERLGHSTVNLTLDTYTHVLPGMQEEASRRLDDLLCQVV